MMFAQLARRRGSTMKRELMTLALVLVLGIGSVGSAYASWSFSWRQLSPVHPAEKCICYRATRNIGVTQRLVEVVGVSRLLTLHRTPAMR
ncbi:MAG: hypothetical protein Nk1A_6470 [Endomicrobiia bacterium]|nr:MAG: hypothetical protein Nk1A_6470 [Endomicrobiia bacterium]